MANNGVSYDYASVWVDNWHIYLDLLLQQLPIFYDFVEHDSLDYHLKKASFSRF
jgi:hypothetical protein